MAVPWLAVDAPTNGDQEGLQSLQGRAVVHGMRRQFRKEGGCGMAVKGMDGG